MSPRSNGPRPPERPEHNGASGSAQVFNDRLELLKASQAELAEANARLQATLDAAVDGIITIDASGTIETANAAALSLFGYESHEIVGTNVKLLMPPPYRSEHDGYLDAYRRTGEKRIIGIGREVIGLRKNGTSFPMELSVGEAFAGERKLFSGVIRDLSARKATEQELHDSLAQMSAVFETAVDGIISIADDGAIESFNRAAERIFGYRALEVIGKNVQILMPPPYAGEHDGYIERFLTTGNRNVIGVGRVVTGLRKDGTTFPMDLAVSEAHGDSKRSFTGIVRDLTEQRNAEEARAALSLILEESLNEIFVFDAETFQFMLVNRGARENLGYTIDELRKLTPVDIKPEFTAKRFKRLVQPLLTGEKERLEFDTTHQRKDGTQYPVEVHLQLATFGGNATFMALIFDVTEKKEALASLEHIERRAHEAEKLASVATLTAGIAHDIGTPMGIILGYSNMIEKSAENEKQRERAHLIGQQIQRVTDLIQTLLNVSRPGEPKLVAVGITETIDHALEFFREKLRKHGISLERDYSEVPEIMGDRDRLEQVFLNLFVNAADAMSNGGQLHVSLHPNRHGWVEVRVRDTGTGIPPDQIKLVFDPFFTTKERGKGNGLGLLVSKGIVTEHGGTISVKSTVGEGTEFQIVLPSIANQ